jgi:lipopolysaccharide biosynthesis regulator YciM
MVELFWLLLPVAAASGWWWAKRDAVQTDATSKKAEYFKGLNYLLDDKPDQAIEVFARMAETDRDIVETHLTLGNLFRRRGEVDRAIHIHHTLSNRLDLSQQQRNRAAVALAEDYMRAGLFDRAENLYRILAQQSEYTALALNRLVDIYEQEKDWQQAIEHCDQLERRTGQVRKIEAAHYCCQLAEEAQRRGDNERVRGLLQQALERDANCSRASIMQGQSALAAQQYATAVKAFKAVERQNPDHFIQVITPLGECYAALNKHDEYIRYLLEVQQRDHSGRLTAALAELITRQRGPAAALDFLESELKQHPSFLGLRSLIELKLAEPDSTGDTHLTVLYQASRFMLNGAVHYHCANCGFTGRMMYWHCPGCKRWNTTKPLPDLLCKTSH